MVGKAFHHAYLHFNLLEETPRFAGDRIFMSQARRRDAAAVIDRLPVSFEVSSISSGSEYGGSHQPAAEPNDWRNVIGQLSPIRCGALMSAGSCNPPDSASHYLMWKNTII